MRCLSWIVLAVVSTTGCVTGAPNVGSEVTDVANGGYFVALAAESKSEETLALYDGLHDAIDGYNRRAASKAGRLSEYVAAFESDGYSRLADERNEIECDLTKCLVKLAAKSIVGAPRDEAALATMLTLALADKGVDPVRTGSGAGQTRTYVLGRQDGLHVACEEKGVPPQASYTCNFNLAARKDNGTAEAVLEPPARGKLVSCALSPGTIRNAEDAKAELEGGDLLELTLPDAAGKPVGYLRYTRQSGRVEFVDLFLCGDLSHDHFFADGAAKTPKAWLPANRKAGGAGKKLETLRDDDAQLVASATLAEETPDGYVLDVAFKLGREAATTGEIYGEDRFRVRLKKEWVQ